MDSRGQAGIVGIVVAAIIGIIGIIVFAEVFNALNTTLVSSGAVNLLNLVDLLLAAGLILAVLAGVLLFRRG